MPNTPDPRPNTRHPTPVEPCSTGPRTPEGKARVRYNGLQHGLTAQDLVVPEEDAPAFLEFRDAFLDHLHPSTPSKPRSPITSLPPPGASAASASSKPATSTSATTI